MPEDIDNLPVRQDFDYSGYLPTGVYDTWKKEGKSEAEIARLSISLYRQWEHRRLKTPRKPPVHRKLPSREKVIELAAQLPVSVIAKKYGCSKNAVYQHLQGTTVLQDRKDIIDSKIVEMFNEGCHLVDIAGEVGLSVKTCIDRLRMHGINVPRSLKPVGCGRCKTDPYAKGLCKPCYERKRKRKKQA